MTHAAGDLGLILLELHPGAATVSGPAPGQRGRNVRRGDPHAGRHPLADRDERPAMRFSRGEPAQHEEDPAMRPGRTPRGTSVAGERPPSQDPSPASRAPSIATGTGPATSSTTALASATALCHTLPASTGTGRAPGRHLVSASRQVNAGTARPPSCPTRAGMLISLVFSAPVPAVPWLAARRPAAA